MALTAVSHTVLLHRFFALRGRGCGGRGSGRRAIKLPPRVKKCFVAATGRRKKFFIAATGRRKKCPVASTGRRKKCPVAATEDNKKAPGRCRGPDTNKQNEKKSDSMPGCSRRVFRKW